MTGSWVEISLSRLRENAISLNRFLSPSTRIIAVVKANGYGHGVIPVSSCLLKCGIHDFAVATLAEAVQLREVLSEASILVLQGCLPGQERVFQDRNLTAAVFHAEQVPEEVAVEVELDTGMGRLGIPWELAEQTISGITSPISGVYSHFSSPTLDPDYTRLQLQRFEKATSGLPYPRHISSSAGLQFPEAQLDAVRLGLALYGISPCSPLDFVRPVLCWKTHILTLQRVSAGQPVGYGGTFVTQRDTLIGVLPIGYADGYNRLLSNRGRVRVRGHLAPILGEVNMDLTSVDLTDHPPTEIGDEVLLLEDTCDSPISLTAMAELLGTNTYEVLVSISSRVERRYPDH